MVEAREREERGKRPIAPPPDGLVRRPQVDTAEPTTGTVTAHGDATTPAVSAEPVVAAAPPAPADTEPPRAPGKVSRVVASPADSPRLHVPAAEYQPVPAALAVEDTEPNYRPQHPTASQQATDAEQLKQRMVRAGQARRQRRPDLVREVVDPLLPDWYEPPAPASDRRATRGNTRD